MPTCLVIGFQKNFIQKNFSIQKEKFIQRRNSLEELKIRLDFRKPAFQAAEGSLCYFFSYSNSSQNFTFQRNATNLCMIFMYARRSLLLLIDFMTIEKFGGAQIFMIIFNVQE